MGCDIHIIPEIRWQGGKWHPLIDCVLTSARDYQLFAFIADVRNQPEWNITPLAQPRGWPSDMSAQAREMWNNDNVQHSFTYISALEADQCRKYDRSHAFTGLHIYCTNIYYGSEVRYLIGFDN